MFEELLRRKMAGVCELSDHQVKLLRAHYDLLQRWNSVINLTSITDEEQIVERHYCESLFLAAHLPPGKLRIVDVGSGAGFPGFPIAVARLECRVMLIESKQRKAVFLKEISRLVDNVDVWAGRAEDFPERFDWLVSRAVNPSELPALAEHTAFLGTGKTGLKLPWGRDRVVCFT